MDEESSILEHDAVCIANYTPSCTVSYCRRLMPPKGDFVSISVTCCNTCSNMRTHSTCTCSASWCMAWGSYNHVLMISLLKYDAVLTGSYRCFGPARNLHLQGSPSKIASSLIKSLRHQLFPKHPNRSQCDLLFLDFTQDEKGKFSETSANINNRHGFVPRKTLSLRRSTLQTASR